MLPTPALAFLLALAPARAEEENPRPAPAEFLGEWTGAQTCASGTYAVALSVRKGEKGTLTAEFSDAKAPAPPKPRWRAVISPDEHYTDLYRVRALLPPRGMFRLETMPLILKLEDRGRMSVRADLSQLQTIAELDGEASADPLRVTLGYELRARMIEARERCEGTLNRKLKRAAVKKPPPEPAPRRPRSAPDSP